MGKMISPMAVRFLSVLILTFWAGAALADKRVALIVGNSQYTRITPRLVNPANDSHDIAKALESIGFEVLLRRDIGKGEFDRSLAEFARKAAGADTALFYYAGHGLQYQGQNFFLPVDIEVEDAADVEFQAVGMDRILEAINRSSGVRIVILDACRDNPLAKQLTRGLGGGGMTRGLARIDRSEGLIIAYATAPDQVAQDGAGRNSPFTESLIRRIKEPGLEIGTMFRRVASDVYERTNGHQRPEYSDSLLSDYFLNPAEDDHIAWSRIRDSNEVADFQEFIRKFPASPFARDAQIRIDLFGRIRRENEEAAKIERERIALEAEKKAHDEEAKKEADRIALEATKNAHDEEVKKEADRIALEAARKVHDEEAKKEADRVALEAAKKAHDEEAKKDADRIALEAARKAQDEEAKKEADRVQAEKQAADERAKVAALEEEDRKKHEIELEKQHTAEICNSDSAKLKELAAALQSAAIQNLAKETACPILKPAIENALREVARGVKRACDADRKTLASLKGNDIVSLKAALDHMTCETVRAEAQQHVAKLEDEIQHKQQVCADDKTKLDAIDASAAGARQQYAELQAHTACASLRADISDGIKKIDSRVKEAQTELARLGCYNAPINGQFDEATKKSLALYNTKKGSLAVGDHLTDGLLSEMKQQNLGLCPTEPPSAPVVATPGNNAPASTAVPPKQNSEQAKREEEARPDHNRQKIEPGGSVPASRPSKPRIKSATHEEEPISRPPRHRVQSAAHEEAPEPRSHQRPHPSFAAGRPKSVIAHAPRTPPGPTAESGSAPHLGHIGGVGF
ncbi:MAG: caspase family protein [Methylocella sp.]